MLRSVVLLRFGAVQLKIVVEDLLIDEFFPLLYRVLFLIYRVIVRA